MNGEHQELRLARADLSQPGWGSVRDGLVLIYTANIAAMLCTVGAVILKDAPPVRLMLLAAGWLAGLAVVIGKFMCRKIPETTGLRGLATAVCCFVAFGWLNTGILWLVRHLHGSHAWLSLAQGLGGLATLIGWLCFMVLLSRIAHQAGDAAPADRAVALLWSALGLVVILICSGVALPTFPRSSPVHRVALPGALLVLIGAFIWVGLYLQLLKRLADRLEQALEAAVKD